MTSLADATTVDLSPWAVRFRQRHTKPARRGDYSWDRVAAALIAVLVGAARYAVAAVVHLVIYAVLFVVVLIGASTLFELLIWRR
ncbi:hypothetical protein GCM10010399_43870 [Dactylosporangium fulvum]|uniref:Integral membrane protein n=1 Tax=Dactylosporangium fulvum TaxID=53359 RepID=A0ABY5WCQ7_9ACTN|nr:hypothetical protein [Dactylosporangium fulvum]UWP85946.1 hypothetical protein Dfulv_17505 [Dactylosporangium fulvum]